MKHLFLSLSILLFFNFPLSAADKEVNWESEFARVDKDFVKGEYKYALRKAEGLLKKIENTYGNEHLMKAKILAYTSRIYEALGKYEDHKIFIDKSINTLQLSKKTDTTLWVVVLEEIASSYFEYGDYVHAEEYLQKALEVYGKRKAENLPLKHDLLDKLAEVAYREGFILKADAMLPELISFRKGRITKKEKYTDAKGIVKERKVPGSELEERKRKVGQLMNLQSLVSLESGNILRTDSLVEEGLSYIKKNLGKKDITFVQALYIRALHFESVKKYQDANKNMEKAIKLASKTKGIKWKNHHKQSIVLQEKHVLTQKLANNLRHSQKRQKILETRISRYYGKDSPYRGRMLLLDAQKDLMDRNYKKAEEKALQVINNPAYSPKNHHNRLEALSIVYSTSLSNDQFLKSEGALDQIIDISKELYGERAPLYKAALLNLAGFQVQYTSKFKEAEEVFNTHLNALAGEIDHRQRNYLNYIYTYATLYQYTDRFEKSAEVLDKALADSKKYYGENSVKYAKALVRISNAYIDLGKYSEAEKNLAKAQDIYKNQSSASDRQDISEGYLTYARLYIIQGQYDEARKSLKKAISKQTGSSEEVRQSEAFEELATLYIELGKYQETEKNLKESIRLKEAKYGNVHRTLVNPLNQLSHLYVITGNYIEAERMAKRAANIASQIFGQSSLKFAESLKILGDVYAAIGDYEKAEDADAKALNIQKQQYGPKHIQVAMSLNDIAIIKFYNKESKEEVESLLNQALKIVSSNLGENNPTYANILYHLGLLYVETGENDKAALLLDKANAIWVQKLGENNLHSATVNFMKGNIAYKKGNYAAARQNYIASKSIYARLFDNMHPGYLAALGRQGQMEYILGSYKEAVSSLDETTKSYLTYIKKYFPSLSEKEKTKFWNKIQKDFEFYNTLMIRMKDENPELIANAYNYALATKAVLLNSSIKVRQRIMESKDPVLIQKFEDWVARKEFLTSAISMTAEQRKESEIDIKLLETEIEGLEKELSNRSELFAKNFSKKEGYDWKDVRKNLLPNETAIEIVRFNHFDKAFTDTIMYAALIITPESKNPDMVLFKDGKDMEDKWLKYYRNCMKFAIEDKNSYKHYWKPIKEKIRDNSVVYLSADGVYNQINLETVPTSDDKYVIDENQIVLVSNTRDLIAKRQADKTRLTEAGTVSNKLVLFGNPKYYTGEAYISEDTTAVDSLLHRGGDDKRKVSQLPGAEQEIRDLNDLLLKNGFPTEAYTNENATEQKIKELSNVRIFHIATHGFFLDNHESNVNLEGLNENKSVQNPLLRSGLLLKDGGPLLEKENVYEFNSSDGILTAYEAMNLNFDECDLVVLSACETGLGKVEAGEGVFGLQRAFLVAGAKTVVMSLFKVNDEVTQELMTEFYKRWIQSKDKRRSFLEAKKAIKLKYNKPIYWGSFIMIGLE